MAKTAKNEKALKKGDKVSYQVGLAPKPIKGTVVRVLKAGTPFPANLIGKLRTTFTAGEILTKDSVLVEIDDGALRLIGAGYIRR